MKKNFRVFMLFLSLFTFFLVGCSAGSDSDNSSLTEGNNGKEDDVDDGIVHLTVWAEESNIEMVSEMTDNFKNKYAGEAEFDITISANPDSGTKSNILKDIHSAPDVFTFPDDQLSGLLASGVLDPVPEKDSVSNANTAESVTAASYNDTLYAYPMTADNGYFLYYNKDYFTENDVKSLNTIISIAEKEGKKFSMELNSGWYMYAFFSPEAGMDFGINDDGVTNHCNWNTTEGAVKGSDIAQSIFEFASSSGFISQPDAEFAACLKDGEVIAGISGVWNSVPVKEAWGDDYGAVKLPTYKCAGKDIQMSSFTGFKMMGVNSYSKNVEWAHKLADFLTNEENQTTRFEVIGQGPSNKNAAASDAVGQVPAIQAVIAQSQYGVLQRVGGKFWIPCQTFADTLIAGNPNNLSMQELVDTLVTGITASTAE